MKENLLFCNPCGINRIMVLALQLYDGYREFILGFGRKKALTSERIALVYPTLMFNVVFCVAGFRPGRRGCCLARPEGRNRCCGAKGPKTIDAPSGLIRGMDISLRGRTNSRSLS
jgi:hypothetical protein